MSKRIISFLLVSLLVLSISPEVQAQEDTPDVIWESIIITPDYTKLKELGESMAKHNKKYHASGKYQAYVYDINTGPNMGQIVWEMGPLTLSDLDGRPSAGGHDEDWRDNVMPYVKKMHTGEYWRQNQKISNLDMLEAGKVTHPLLFIRYHEVEDDGGYLLQGVLKQISETIKGMDGDHPWGVYENMFRQGDRIGRHLATVGFFKNWTDMDRDNNFKATFMKVHGEDAWDNFLEAYDNTFSNSWDEIWEYNAALSGK